MSIGSPPPAAFTPTMRALIENVIEDLLLLLDEIDGDPDLEDDSADMEHDGCESDRCV